MEQIAFDTKKNIGIDAKWFFSGPPSGKVVVRNLIKELLSQNNKDNFFIFLKKSDKKKEFPFLYDNVELIYVPNVNNALANVVLVPLLSRKLNLDIFLFQNFPSPFGAFKSINYVHDVLFLDYPQYFSLKELLYLWPIKYLTKFADYIVTISQSEKTRLLKHGFNSKCISVVYHGIDKKYYYIPNRTEIERIKKKYGLPDKYILYLGRLNKRKNISSLVAAMEFVNDAVLVIAGKKDGDYLKLKDLISKKNLQKQVKFTGHVSSKDISILYRLAHVFCFPSFVEGFGLPPLEAMATGTPVVTSHTTSLPEVCHEAALYADPKNPREIAAKINNLLDDESLHSVMSSKGLLRSKEFGWKTSANQINCIIDNLIKK